MKLARCVSEIFLTLERKIYQRKVNIFLGIKPQSHGELKVQVFLALVKKFIVCFLFAFVLLLFWDNFPLCCPGWSQTYHPPASECWGHPQLCLALCRSVLQLPSLKSVHSELAESWDSGCCHLGFTLAAALRSTWPWPTKLFPHILLLHAEDLVRKCESCLPHRARCVDRASYTSAKYGSRTSFTEMLGIPTMVYACTHAVQKL